MTDTMSTNAGEAQLDSTVPVQQSGDYPTPKQIQEKFEKGTAAIRAQQYDFWLNSSFLLGEQHLYWNGATRSLAQLPRDPDRVQMTVNRMWPASRTHISRLVSRPLVFDVPPTGADDATIRAAMTAESILMSLKDEHDWETIREDVAWSTWKGGTAAICVEWDSSLGEPLGVTDDGREYATGDTVETALSVVDFVTEPGARNAERGGWWIKNVALPPETVQGMWPESFPEDPPPSDATAALTPFQAKLLNDHSGVGSNVELTKVLTYYERPSKKRPAGAMVVVVGKHAVEEGPWPFSFKDKLNLIMLRETYIPGKAYGATVLSAARSIQSAINQSWSSIVEHMKLAGNARLFVPQSVIDQIQDLTDLPGEIVPYPDEQAPPQWTAPPQMPSWWIQQPAALALEMDSVLGIHDVTRGEAPSNIESGLGLSILIEQDQSPLGRLTKEVARAFGRMGQLVLDIYQQNVQETRQAVVRTPGQPAETVGWTGGNLLGQTAAQVPVDAIMPRNRAQQMEFANTAMQMGLITTIEQWVRLAEHPDQRSILETLSPDVAKARRENAKLAMGVPEPPAIFDNHLVHIGEHLTFMKGPRWDTLSTEVQTYFIMHNQGHANMDAELLGRRQAMGQLSPVLAAAADPNGAPVLPLNAIPGAGGMPGEGGAGSPEANADAPAATDPGKKTGNAISSAKAANKDFASDPETVTGGMP